MTLTKAEAAQELLRRRAARSSLVGFAKFIEVPGAPAVADDDTESFLPAETPLAAHHELILNATQRCIERPNGRTMLFLPPGSAKSSYATVVSPTWVMGAKPGFRTIAVSYGADLARKFGRRMRSIVKQPAYGKLFDTGLSAESSAAHEWALDNGSEFMGGGILSGITGNRADFIAIDDPIKGRQDADSEAVRKSTLDAYQEDVLTRLKPGGSLMLTQCMVGSTPVLMADGTETPLSDIRPGDAIATYDDGRLSVSVVENWANQGADSVYEINMTSGISVKANARHPFLVERNGELLWVKLKNMEIGDRVLRVIGESGRGLRAPMKGVTSLSGRKATAIPITTRPDGQTGFGRRLPSTPSSSATPSFATAMVSGLLSMMLCLPSKVAFALFAREAARKDRPTIGLASCALTTITSPRGCVGFSATTAILSSDVAETSRRLSGPLSTLSVTTDTVLSILHCGVEDVYDIQVVRTENFIANGLISHNTRWHESDLAGSILPEGWAGESGMIDCRDGATWEVICLPAKCERLDDPLGRKVGEYLWPEWFKDGHWAPFERMPRTWSALYQQRPAPDTGDYFKREWVHVVEQMPPRETMMVYGGSDYAVTASGGDYTVHIVLGVDSQSRMWVLDLWRAQASSDKWVEAFCDLVIKWKPIGWAEETGQIKSGVGPFLLKEQALRGAYVVREAFPTRGDKAVRAQSIRGRMAMHGLYVQAGAPFLEALLSEMMSFPVAVHDDQVDALGLCGQLMDRMSAGVDKKEAPEKPVLRTLDEVYATPLIIPRRR